MPPRVLAVWAKTLRGQQIFIIMEPTGTEKLFQVYQTTDDLFELLFQAFAIPRELRTIHSTVPGDALSRVSNLFTREVHGWFFNYFKVM